ncbi:MAG: hypothetical protein ACR2MY_09645 [Candidatus Dormibacteria bacterium]
MRGLALAVALIAPLGPAAAVRAASATAPTGTCVDFLYFDGLDTRHTAAQCANALNQAGYAGAAFDDGSAQNEVSRSPQDAVFFHAGHSLDYYDPGGHTAVALLFESPAQGSTFDALLGDPLAAQVAEGPMTICNDQNQCRSVDMVAYPWADTPQMFKYNLVVLESCATAHVINSFQDIADVASGAGAGSVLAFTQDVSFPVNADDSNQYGDAWANRFWSDTGGGQSYQAAAIDAANAVGNGYGYGSWKLLRPVPSAPSSLYPAQYYLGFLRRDGMIRRSQLKIYGAAVIAAGSLAAVAIGGRASIATPPASLDSRTVALNHFIGGAGLHDDGWRLVSDQAGGRYKTQVSGVGLVEVDAVTHEVDEVIFDGRLSSIPGTPIALTQAESTAGSFARAHFAGFGALAPRGTTLVDHGVFREYRSTWQARQGQASLPSQVAVGVNATTGQVAYYWSQRLAVTVSTQPKVSAAAALRSAQGLAEGLTASAAPDLEVAVREGHQQLVWVTTFTRNYSSGLHVSDNRVVWTDAQTDVSQIVARG